MGKITLGLVADTHVPDRLRQLHPNLLPSLERTGVQAILHAGDIAMPRVLKQLEQIAPVAAVRGNRDWWPGLLRLPLQRILDFGGMRIGLTHGHGNLLKSVWDKGRYLLRGARSFDYYAERAQAAFTGKVDAVVFGHNHAPMLKVRHGLLVINPGSACCQVVASLTPTFALLHIENGELRGEIVNLEA